LLPGFTGISDPYEVPSNADLVIDTETESAVQAASRIIEILQDRGYLANPAFRCPGEIAQE
jgi:sulfate adenylyltransferase